MSQTVRLREGYTWAADQRFLVLPEAFEAVDVGTSQVEAKPPRPSRNTHARLLTVAETMQVSVATAHRLVKGGEIPAIQVGGRYRIPRGEFETYLSRLAPPAPSRRKKRRRVKVKVNPAR